MRPSIALFKNTCDATLETGQHEVYQKAADTYGTASASKVLPLLKKKKIFLFITYCNDESTESICSFN